VGFKLGEGKGLREGRNSKELWKSVEKRKTPAERRSGSRIEEEYNAETLRCRENAEKRKPH